MSSSRVRVSVKSSRAFCESLWVERAAVMDNPNSVSTNVIDINEDFNVDMIKMIIYDSASPFSVALLLEVILTFTRSPM